MKGRPALFAIQVQARGDAASMERNGGAHRHFPRLLVVKWIGLGCRARRPARYWDAVNATLNRRARE
jgi:hypothetical protein